MYIVTRSISPPGMCERHHGPKHSVKVSVWFEINSDHVRFLTFCCTRAISWMSVHVILAKFLIIAINTIGSMQRIWLFPFRHIPNRQMKGDLLRCGLVNMGKNDASFNMLQGQIKIGVTVGFVCVVSWRWHAV